MNFLILLKKKPYTILAFVIFIIFLFSIPRPKSSFGLAPSRQKLIPPETSYTKLNVEELSKLVGNHPNYLVKDSHSSFGYNNIRYMFETTLILARLLNRIPILPESIWARNCAVASKTCTEHSLRHFSHRNSHMKELGLKWNEDGEAWKIGIEHFLDVPHLRTSYGPVLLMNEFHNFYDIPLDLIEGSGHFNSSTQVPASLELSILPNDEFESSEFIRVDRLYKAETKVDQGRGRLNRFNMTSLLKDTGKNVWKVEEVREIVKRSAGESLSRIEEAELGKELEEIGIIGLFTFSDRVTMNKALVTPTIEYSFLTSLLPFSPLPSPKTPTKNSILYLPGDLHDQRHPGALRFSTNTARSEFVEIVQKCVRPPKGIRDAGELAVKRMREKVGGRKFVGGHLRRGDFVGLEGWSSELDPVADFEKTRKALLVGIREVALRSYNGEVPITSDLFYIATDETSPSALEYYRSHQGVLLSDLISRKELDELIGPSSSYTDILSLVEQQILGETDFFVGSKFSSTTGGVLNLREGNGKGSWSWLLL